MNHLQKIKEKVCSLSQAKALVTAWQKEGQQVVFTNGCFDILHKGHVTYLAKAASMGDQLILAINSDESVRTLGKADNRPINTELDRAFLLAGLEIIDAVIIFNDSTPEKIIKELSPNILVKGGDYDESITDSSDPKYIVGRDYILENGGEIKTIPTVDGYSTTNTISKINS